MKISVKELREKYPNPVIASSIEDSYCVGGALCLELNESRFPADRFPTVSDLRDALITANPNLSINDAMDYANLITHSNDAENFEDAWQTLETALTYDSKKIPKENQNG